MGSVASFPLQRTKYANNSMHSVSVELDHRVFPLDSRETKWIQSERREGEGWTRMGIERARSAERASLGMQTSHSDINSRARGPPATIIRLPGDFVIQIGPWTSVHSMEKPLFNAETAPRPSKRAREPSIHARQSGTSGSCVAPVVSLEKPPRKKLYRVSLDSR